MTPDSATDGEDRQGDPTQERSQAEVAKRAGLSREYANKIEADKYDPPLSTINAIAEALGVKPRKLME
jgi:transcriptional regulator with XRE-family HTH domain